MSFKCKKCGHEEDFSAITVFLGKPFDYWVDLQTRVEEINATKLIEEIVHLKAKAYDYETQMNKIREITQ